MKITKFRIVKMKIPKATIKKYGWKNPYYYEIRKGGIRYAWYDTKKLATSKVNLLNKTYFKKRK